MMYHKELTPERWFKFSTTEQLGNVACDMGRAINWRKKGDIQYSQTMFTGALILLDLTIDDPKNKGSLCEELRQVREKLVDHFMLNNAYNATDDEWDRYFYTLLWAAALEREKRFNSQKILS
jgi:hypothetical protein